MAGSCTTLDLDAFEATRDAVAQKPSFSLEADEPAPLGGTDAAVDPVELVLPREAGACSCRRLPLHAKGATRTGAVEWKLTFLYRRVRHSGDSTADRRGQGGLNLAARRYRTVESALVCVHPRRATNQDRPPPPAGISGRGAPWGERPALLLTTTNEERNR